MKVVIVVAIVCGLLGCSAAPPSAAPTVLQSFSPSLPLTSPTPTSSPSPPLSSGGIPQARAIELARDHTSFTTLVSAAVGSFRDLNIQRGVGLDYPIKPDQIVWAVTFSGDVTICSPVGKCFSPRPAVIAVFLDPLTGDFLSSEANAPAP
jgi:hypothetical protein